MSNLTDQIAAIEVEIAANENALELVSTESPTIRLAICTADSSTTATILIEIALAGDVKTAVMAAINSMITSEKSSGANLSQQLEDTFTE